VEQIFNDRRTSMPRETILLHPSKATSDENYPTLDDSQAFKSYFEREGFIVVRNAVAAGLCEAAKRAFMTEVLPDKSSFFLRHESGTYDRHVLTEAGFMKYPIMNIQDISDKKYGTFRKSGLDLLTQPTVQRAVENVFGEPGRLIHTMFFDGNQTTWAHRDGHYIDSQPTGKMIGIWVAAEDIKPGAGRFYIIPRSHQMPIPGELDDPNGAAYKTRMAEFVRNGPLDCVAPILTQGDMLMWTSGTIHGSLPTLDQQFPRRSFTAHYIPQSCQFRWSGGEASRKSITMNGVAVTLHGAQSALSMRVKNLLRTRYPALYTMARNVKRGSVLTKN
jgi:phytanoyl-CoA hydroxylase